MDFIAGDFIWQKDPVCVDQKMQWRACIVCKEGSMNYDAVVVGAGFTGAALAYQFAKDGKKVLVLEKRAHIAGNMYDYKSS